MKSIINSVSKTYFINRKYIYTCDEIFSYQDELLVDLMIANKDTFVGKKYNFEYAVNYDSFKNNVPIFHYDDYKEYIYMSVRGEDNIICSDEIDFWAKTSGTTNDYQKYIPVTKRYLENNHYKGGKDTFSNYVNSNLDTKLFEGKGIVLGGSMSKNEFTGIDNVGFISAILQTNNNPLVKLFFTEPDQDISFLTNRSEKIDKIIDGCKCQNIVSSIGVTSRNIYLMKNMIEKLGIKYVNDIWPDYELFLTGGMNYRPLELNIRKLFSKNINIWQAYNTSEGYFGVQLSNNSYFMQLLCCHDVYYEFLDQESYNTQNYQNIVNLHNIKNGIDYVIIITNSAGLYRYVIGDTVRFFDVNNFLFEIIGRTKDYLNLFSEQLRENHTNQAISNINAKFGINISDYHVGSIMSDRGDGSGMHYRLMEIENDDFNYLSYIYNGDNLTLSDLEQEIDNELKKLNLFYDGKRKGDMILQKPTLKILSKGTFYRRLQSKGKLGGQNKVPKLRNDDFILNEILKFDNKEFILL